MEISHPQPLNTIHFPEMVRVLQSIDPCCHHMGTTLGAVLAVGLISVRPHV